MALVAAPAALAHGTLTPAVAEAGSDQAFELIVPADRLDADITGVALRVPEGVEVIAAEAEQPLWTVIWDDAGVSWEGGPIDRGSSATFRFTARMPPDGGVAELTLVETYDDGVAAPFPLPVTVSGDETGSSSQGLALAALLVAIAALAASTAALALALKGRRT